MTKADFEHLLVNTDPPAAGVEPVHREDYDDDAAIASGAHGFSYMLCYGPYFVSRSKYLDGEWFTNVTLSKTASARLQWLFCAIGVKRVDEIPVNNTVSRLLVDIKRGRGKRLARKVNTRGEPQEEVLTIDVGDYQAKVLNNCGQVLILLTEGSLSWLVGCLKADLVAVVEGGAANADVIAWSKAGLHRQLLIQQRQSHLQKEIP
jgi:hypothetical protein